MNVLGEKTLNFMYELTLSVHIIFNMLKNCHVKITCLKFKQVI